MEQTQSEDNIFRQGLRNASDNKHFPIDLPTHAETQKFSLKKKITKREQSAIETLVNNSLAKEGSFHRLNERFVPNKTGDIIFSMRIFRTVQTMNTSQTICRGMPKHRTFP